MQTNNHYDVIINGAGVVGLSAALALADTNLQIAIIEKNALPDALTLGDHDLRVFALNLATKNFLQSMGVWSDIRDLRAAPYRHMYVWDSENQSDITFHCTDMALPELGHIVENRVLRHALLNQLATHDNVHMHEQMQIQAICYAAELVTVKTSSADLQAQLLIAADGANSYVRNQAGIRLQTWDYQQIAIVATVKTRKPHQHTARQVFLPTGPLAFLPLTDPSLCSIVWSCDVAVANELLALNDTQFASRLTAAFDATLGDVSLHSARMNFPLRMRHANNYVQSRLALIGDAAHTIHPLAGQGVNLGFMDVTSLTNVILTANAKQRDIGAYTVLRRYERMRKGHNLSMIMGMEGFKRTFSSTLPFMPTLRGLGMTAVDKMPWLKQFFMQQAIGL